jgi:hypothetical protein
VPQTAGVTTAPEEATEPTGPTAEAASSIVATRRRRAGMVAIWVAGTATAMVLATLAVQVAGAKVTQRPAATVSRSQIETEVARQRTATTPPAESGAGTAGPSAAGPASDPEAPAGAGGDGGSGAPSPTAPGSPSSPSSTPRPSSTTPAVEPGRSPVTSAAPPVSRAPVASTSPTVSAPSAPPPSAAPPPTTAAVSEQTYVLTGGSVRVRCTGTTVQRLSSSPAPGFAMEIRSSGPQEVDVRFDAAAHRSELKASCSATGAIMAEPREEDHGGGGAGTGSTGP